MKNYSEIYSEQGLRAMIQDNERKIKEKEKEYEEAEVRYNPLMAVGNRKEIKSDIASLQILNVELNKSLEEKIKNASQN